MLFSSFTVLTYKVKIDHKLVPFAQIAKRLEIVAGTKMHEIKIKGSLIFEGESLATPLGSFRKETPFKSTLTVTLPENDFSHVYAVFRTEKPVFIMYNADATFEEVDEGQTVEIKGARIQTDDESVGEGVDAS